MDNKLRWLWIILFGVLLWWAVGPSGAPIAQFEGLPEPLPTSFDHRLSIAGEPLQTATARMPEAIVADHFVLRPIAEFEVEARVLSRRNYRRGIESRLSPLDLALGWGPMADPEVLQHIRISQSRRYFYWRVREFPIPRRQIETNSANMHLIPANRDIARQLDAISRDDQVRLGGWLVDIDRDDGWRWRTSRTRTDTGAGACEIVFVTRVARL